MRVFLPCFVLLLLALPGFAQKPDTAFLAASVSSIRQLYQAGMKGESPLNSGAQYVDYVSVEGEHPYYIAEWSYGSVQYFDDVYHGVPLLLDLRSDKLITRHGVFDMRIALTTQKVKTFTLAGHRFVNLRQDSIKALPESGFYDFLQTGNTSLIARRKKNIQYTMSSGKSIAILKETNLYYLLKDGHVIPVSSRKSIVKALGDRPDLKAQLKKNKVKFGRNREAGLSATVRIYNELVSSQ